MLERAKEVTRRGPYTYLEYARFADDLVILVDAYPQHDWLLKAVDKRLREELATLQVAINEEKAGWLTWLRVSSSASWALTSGGCGADEASGGRGIRPG